MNKTRNIKLNIDLQKLRLEEELNFIVEKRKQKKKILGREINAPSIEPTIFKEIAKMREKVRVASQILKDSDLELKELDDETKRYFNTSAREKEYFEEPDGENNERARN